MWKKFFYFDRKQKIVLIISLILLCGVLLIQFLLKNYKRIPIKVDNSLQAEVDSFCISLQKKPVKKYKEYYGRSEYNSQPNKNITVAYKPTTSKIKRFVFDPNTLDSAGFIQLGIKPYIIRNILKYRLKNGFYDTPEAFAKTYGLSLELFQELKPYIQITPRAKKEKNETTVAIVNLNQADTIALAKIWGIKPWMARKIFFYGKQLGGYISVNQLYEIKNIPKEKIDKILPYLTVSGSVEKIKINRSSVDKIRRHPYVNFYQAKAIVEYRKTNGKITTEKELTAINDENLTPEFWQKVLPYVSLE